MQQKGLAFILLFNVLILAVSANRTNPDCKTNLWPGRGETTWTMHSRRNTGIDWWASSDVRGL